ncbi:TetR/AcrR family transcriptional regulator [Actinophytocola xanthii]|uniref:TetR family transcriptional regulator n=1 Tax=Actinophytocola xanthii TaxID=1912961 RepID=A0A1Q8CKZ0_9PSEU|nr:TetR/AcrR family transcriptional regulator [Actinophytocola xanthii]OLF15022.1 TetR family transcriptional regulator [Actinophytocola xanthii]
MTAQERRERERAARHQMIIDTAREVAEAEGWDAVTTRRLAERIEYSQPVLYSHFSGKDAIVRAVALQGFDELAEVLRVVRRPDPAEALRRMAYAYHDFALRQPALYDAMFVLSTDLAFGAPDTPEPLRAAFAELGEVVAELAPDHDTETYTEVLWSALHGLVTLGRSDRLRADVHHQRLDLMLERFIPPASGSRRRKSSGRGANPAPVPDRP